MLKRSRYSIIKVGLVCAVVMFFVMLPSMVSNNGIYIIRGDYVDQYLPRLIKAKKLLSGGFATWDWYNFFGASYNRFGAIFTLNSVCLLFPQRLIPYVVTYIHLVRAALIGMASYAFLKSISKSDKHCFLGALLYTFSSYSFVNFEFMQFLDALWAFPLLLLAAEKMFQSDKYNHWLILCAFVSCAISFYFFVFSTISFSIYFLCRFFFSAAWQKKRDAKHFIIAVIEYVLGFLCAFVVVAPYLYRTFNSAGSAQEIGTKIGSKLICDNTLFSRLFSLFTPASTNRFNTFGWSRWNSMAAYVPIFGVSFVFSLLCKKDVKDRKWICVLSIAALACVMSSGISLVFNMFSSTYLRYAYAMILFFVIATVIFLDNYDATAAKKGVRITAVAFGSVLAVYMLCYFVLGKFSAAAEYLVYTHDTEKQSAHFYMLFSVVAALCMLFCLILFVKSKAVRKRIVPLTATVLVVYGSIYTLVNLKDENLLDYFPSSDISLKEQVEKYFIELPYFEEGDDYRIDFSPQLRNYSYVATKPSITVFESVRNTYASEMADALNMQNGKVDVYPVSNENGLRTLMGVKYYYDLCPKDNVPIPEGFVFVRQDNSINVYENENYIGMGFSYGNYITRSDFNKLKPTNPADFMLNVLVVEDDDKYLLEDVLPYYDGENSTYEKLKFDSFNTTSKGFTATVSAEKTEIMYVSLPYEDKGWTASVNGEEVDIIRANVGCVAFEIQAGENTVVFEYKSPAEGIGFTMSLVGIALVVIYLMLYKAFYKRINI